MKGALIVCSDMCSLKSITAVFSRRDHGFETVSSTFSIKKQSFYTCVCPSDHVSIYLIWWVGEVLSSGSSMWLMCAYVIRELFTGDNLFFLIICKYTVAVFRYPRRGRQISLQVVVSHHVVAGI